MLLQLYFPFPALNRQTTFFKKLLIFFGFTICFHKDFCTNDRQITKGEK